MSMCDQYNGCGPRKISCAPPGSISSHSRRTCPNCDIIEQTTSAASFVDLVSHTASASVQSTTDTTTGSTGTQLPLRFIEIPRVRCTTGSARSGSVSTPSCLDVGCAISERLCGSRSTTSPLFSRTSSDMVSSVEPSRTDPTYSVTTPSIFKLQPRQGVVHGNSLLTSSGAGLGRKRSAQTMTCAPRALPSIGPLEISGKRISHSPVISTEDDQAKPHGRSSSPVAHRRVDVAAFRMNALSLQSPLSHGGAPPISSICSPAHTPLGIPESYTVDHPAATPTSFAGNSSCFSKVVTSPSNYTVESSFRRYRSPAMDSEGDHCATTGQAELRSILPLDMGASRRIVTLTVLTHTSLLLTPTAGDSKLPPSSSSSWLSTSAKNQRHEFLRHTTGAAGMSPFMRSLRSQSTHSTKSKDSSVVSETDALHTPQGPPLSSVHLFCPDTTISTISLVGSTRSAFSPTHTSPNGQSMRRVRDSPSKQSTRSLGTAYSFATKNQYQPHRTSLTPRCTVTFPASQINTLPRFPSPTEDVNMTNDAIRFSDAGVDSGVLPKRTLPHATEMSSMHVSIPNVLDVSLLAEPDLNCSGSFDLSADASFYQPSSLETASSEFAPRSALTESYVPFPSCGTYPPRSARSAVASLPESNDVSFFASPDRRCNVTGSLSLPLSHELESPEDVASMEQRVVGRTKCSMFADNESLSDGEDDEQFVLAVPSILAEDNRHSIQDADGMLRQSKQPRLQFGSMTSMASATSLYGVNFAHSSTSLCGMGEQMCFNPSPLGRLIPTQRRVPSMRREQSSSSIGLDLELTIPSIDKNGFESNSAGRDLITPPVMTNAQSSPVLSSGHWRDDPSDPTDSHNNSQQVSTSYKTVPLSRECTKQAVG